MVTTVTKGNMTRQCNKCNEIKPTSEFLRQRQKCKACLNQIHEFRKQIRTFEVEVQDIKLQSCNKCNTSKNPVDFYPGDKACKSCRSQYNLSRIYSPDNDFYLYRKYLCDTTKLQAKTQNVEFDLKPEDIEIPNICPILNIPIVVSQGKTTDNSPVIVRIDSNGHYCSGNVQVVSSRANVIRRNLTPSELRHIADWLETKTKSTAAA